MGFLKRKLSKDNTAENIDTLTTQCETAISDNPEYTHLNALENSYDSNSVNFMSKFFRHQKLSISHPPETLYENEAWAPEPEFVGLFRKRRVNAEEQTSPSSGPQ